jgi:hypothetical protein
MSAGGSLSWSSLAWRIDAGFVFTPLLCRIVFVGEAAQELKWQRQDRERATLSPLRNSRSLNDTMTRS